VKNLLCSVFFYFIVLASSVFAATSISIANAPSSLDQNSEMEIDITFVCNGCSDSYIRGVFYPSGTSYFGFTQNKEGIWTNASGSKCMEYYKIAQSDLVEGSWSGKLKLKPDLASSFYIGPGEYFLKVGRYTSSCGSPTWSGETTMIIMGPSPTYTPTQTPIPTSSPIPMPSTSPTQAPTNMPTRTKTPTPTVFISSDAQSVDSSESAQVLGTTESLEESSISSQTRELNSFRIFAIAAALVALGLALITGTLIWQKRHDMKNKDDILM
jgi:hypothetical protein